MALQRRKSLAVGAWFAACIPAAHADLTADETRNLCVELGITPATMTALGLNLSESQEALERLEVQDAIVATLRTAQSQIHSLSSELRSKRVEAQTAELVSDAQAAEAEASSLESQIATLANSVESYENQLVAVFMPNGSDMAAAVRMLDPNPASARLSAEYRVLDLSEDDAKELSAALAAKRRADARGEPVPADALQIINLYANHPQVTAARNAMTVWMPQVEQLFFLWQ